MLFRDRGRAIDTARVADLGGTRIALEQKWLWPCAGHAHAAGQNQIEYPSNLHAFEATPPRKKWPALINMVLADDDLRSLRSRVDQRLDQLNRV
jgi:hypothetical protein